MSICRYALAVCDWDIVGLLQGSGGPATLRGKWHSERGSERVSERVLGDL